MDTHLEVVDIRKVEEGKGMDKENSQALSLVEALELVMKIKLPLLWMIWKMTFALCRQWGRWGMRIGMRWQAVRRGHAIRMQIRISIRSVRTRGSRRS